MYVVLTVVPFVLAARVVVNAPWEYGPEYTFQVRVNSTAIPEEGGFVSNQLNAVAKLVCQPKGLYILSCYFRDSKADSYVSLDGIPAVPVNQEAYAFNPDRFEIVFSEQGLDTLLVNENIQPRELDMIRVIVDQLNIGTGERYDNKRFMMMEKFTLGECMTFFDVDENITDYPLHKNRGYLLNMLFGKGSQPMQIRKSRLLHMCNYKVPYFFGSAESLGQVSDVVSTVTSSQSYITITPTDFISSTTNVVTTNKISEEMKTTLYENISLMLESILPAKSKPPRMKDPERTSIGIGGWSLIE